MQRVLQFALLALFLVGLVFAWTSGRRRSDLVREYNRIIQTTGELSIVDPTKVHFRALDTGDPMHFAWRVYLPPNFRQVIRYGAGGQGSSWSASSQEFIARVRFREEEGQLQVYVRFSGGSSRMTCGDFSVAELLRDRWDELEIEQLGRHEIAVLDPEKSAIILRISMPESMAEQAKEKLPKYMAETYAPVFYELGLGEQSLRKPSG